MLFRSNGTVTTTNMVRNNIAPVGDETPGSGESWRVVNRGGWEKYRTRKERNGAESEKDRRTRGGGGESNWGRSHENRRIDNSAEITDAGAPTAPASRGRSAGPDVEPAQGCTNVARCRSGVHRASQHRSRAVATAARTHVPACDDQARMVGAMCDMVESNAFR